MAKNKLIVEYEYDFSLYGIISISKDYRLAWLINKYMDLHLRREEDIKISFLNDENLVISNYLYETEHAQLRMLKNKSEDRKSDKMSYLIPELNKFDYLIMKNGRIGDLSDQELLREIQKIKEVQYIVALDIDKLKSKENLIF
jgi:hypothetical protein